MIQFWAVVSKIIIFGMRIRIEKAFLRTKINIIESSKFFK